MRPHHCPSRLLERVPAHLTGLARVAELPAWAGILLTLADAADWPWLHAAVWAVVVVGTVARVVAARLTRRSRPHRPSRQTPSDSDHRSPGQRD